MFLGYSYRIVVATFKEIASNWIACLLAPSVGVNRALTTDGGGGLTELSGRLDEPPKLGYTKTLPYSMSKTDRVDWQINEL